MVSSDNDDSSLLSPDSKRPFAHGCPQYQSNEWKTGKYRSCELGLDTSWTSVFDKVFVLYQSKGMQVTNDCRGIHEVAVVDMMIVVELIAKVGA
jgi:hypothetical protein